MNPKLVIGVTGENLSGKGKFVDILGESFGFQTTSISNSLRMIASKIGWPKDSGRLADIGDILRIAIGPQGAAQVTLRELKIDKEKLVIDSVRHPAEMEHIREFFGKETKVIFIAIRADNEVRFERGKVRGREGDPKTLEEFIAREKNDMENANEYEQQVKRCIDLADYTLWNNFPGKEELRKEIEKLLISINEGNFKWKERK